MGFIIIGVILLICLIACIKIVPESKVYVIERLGKYHATLNSGINFIIPFIDVVRSRVSLKEMVLDFPPQGVITKDNVTMKIDSVVYAKVFDAKLFTYGVENPRLGIETLAATTLRNLVGALDFDDTLTSRDRINSSLEATLDEATDAWGIKITRVEVKNIAPPSDILDVMQKQMTAEREKRQAVTEAEAHKQSVVMMAEGDKQAKVLQAEAERDAAIARAEGEAKSIQLRAEAEARALEMLTAANVSPEVLKLKGLEALKDVADGNATKIFVPTDLTDVISNVAIAGDSFKSGMENPAAKKAKPLDTTDKHMASAKNPRSESKIHQQAHLTNQQMSAQQSALTDEEISIF